MKNIKYYILFIFLVGVSFQSCFDLTEDTFSKVDGNTYYENESSVKGAISSIYGTGLMSYVEYFWYLSEFSADQITWRSWNGGAWGYDEGEKFVLSIHRWSPDAKIIQQTWETAWETIGKCNQALHDLSSFSGADLGMSNAKLDMYRAEIRTLRAWAYYNIFEVWGGALPLNVDVTTNISPSADPDFDTGCKKIYNFIMTELDESAAHLVKNEVNRMNQAVNRMIKARLLFNAEVFIKENHFSECATICQEILDGEYGNYELATDHQDIYAVNNHTCPEVIMAFANETGHVDVGWMRGMPFLPYNIWEYLGGTYDVSGWNCVCLTPSYDNSGTVNPWGGSQNPKSFLTHYGDKLGAVYERYDDRDIRKQVYTFDYTSGKTKGMFLIGPMKANFGTGEALKADADRDGQDLVYVDQVGTFSGAGNKQVEDVMSPRWGETNSGVRLIKYPILPETAGSDFRDADEVEFRLAEVYYMLAECEMRGGESGTAKSLVNMVRKRYFSDADWVAAQNDPGPGFNSFDLDWMLSQWGLEFLGEGRRRRTDLRRHDKFTQGQWWFFGRTSEPNIELPAKRDRKYEWFPLPQRALTVNPLLTQNPNYTN